VKIRKLFFSPRNLALWVGVKVRRALEILPNFIVLQQVPKNTLKTDPAQTRKKWYILGAFPKNTKVGKFGEKS